MGFNVAVWLLPLPDRWRWPKKRRRVYRGLPERRLRHHGGHNGAAGTMGLSPNERFVGISGACCVGLGGCQHHMMVHDSAMGDQERGQGATAKGGQLQEGGGRG
jgi:hypothetical protein